MSNDQAVHDYYQQNPNAPTPVQGSVDNDVRITIERIAQEVKSSQPSSSSNSGASGSGSGTDSGSSGSAGKS